MYETRLNEILGPYVKWHNFLMEAIMSNSITFSNYHNMRQYYQSAAGGGLHASSLAPTGSTSSNGLMIRQSASIADSSAPSL